MPEVIDTHPSIAKFVSTLPETIQSKIYVGFRTIERYGENMGFPDARKIESNLYEFRITGATHVRILYTVLGDKAYILNIFIKKSAKTPHRELSTAQRRLKHIIAQR